MICFILGLNENRMLLNFLSGRHGGNRKSFENKLVKRRRVDIVIDDTCLQPGLTLPPTMMQESYKSVKVSSPPPPPTQIKLLL
jgi:hypothetical protein